MVGDGAADNGSGNERTTMSEPDLQDFYELLQISPNAEPETIHRVYRLLAQRHHPDNSQTGDAARFRALVEASSESVRNRAARPIDRS
jgi:DnaJ-domain-containing protein 1